MKSGAKPRKNEIFCDRCFLFLSNRLGVVYSIIIFGDDINSEDISSLPPEQFDMYEKIFYDPL